MKNRAKTVLSTDRKRMFYFTPSERGLIKIARGDKLTKIEEIAIDLMLLAAVLDTK